MQVLRAALVIWALPLASVAQTLWRVPLQHRTIQAAIDVATHGDTVLVAPGTYAERIDFKGKRITVRSNAGPAFTAIDGGGLGSVVRFTSGEDRYATLPGFTVRNGGYDRALPVGVGAGILCNGASPSIRDNRVVDNGKTFNGYEHAGGGIYCADSSALLIGNVITGNGTGNPEGTGGGVFLGGRGNPVLQDNVIAENRAGRGGGIACDALAAPVLRANVVARNIAWAEGGGIFIAAVTGTIAQNDISENRAADGGGIFCLAASATFAGNRIAQNRVDGSAGGGIYCAAGAPLFDGNVIVENDGHQQGGGVHVAGGTAVLRNGVIAANHAQSGGGIACVSGAPRMINVTLHGNRSFVGGGIFAYGTTTPSAVNTIVWDNVSTSPVAPGEIAGNVQASHSLVKGGWPGIGNLKVDPMFVDVAAQDFHLQALSPCRDAGTDPGGPRVELDYEGDPRAAFGATDIGADEWHPHLYLTGKPAPGARLELRGIAAAGSIVVIGVSWLPMVREHPLPVPGFGGALHLAGRVDVLAVGIAPARGMLAFPFQLPPTVPMPFTVPVQAVLGLDLSNPVVITAR